MNLQELHTTLVEVAALSPCAKRKVGAIITVDKVVNGIVDYLVLAKGYNYNPNGTSCEDDNGKTFDTVIHAEVACLADFKYASAYNIQYTNQTMHITHEPCSGCQAAILAAGLKYTVMRKTPNEPTKLADTLVERGSTYGRFVDNAGCTQSIMSTLKAYSGRGLETWELEALHMIAHKMSRIVVGKKKKKDNWHDIAGYAKLAEDETIDQ